MGVDTKGFVLTQCKDALLIAALVQGALDRIIRDGARALHPGQPRAATERFRSCVIRLLPHARMAQVQFTYDGESRGLSLFFACDVDQRSYGPSSISMSMGCSGRSELFMRAALHALSCLGPAYLDVNDCDDVGPALLDEPGCTLLGAVGLGYLSPYFYEELREQCPSLPGVPEADAGETVRDASARWKALKAYARSSVALPSFLAG